jgi:hypothetical protein
MKLDRIDTPIPGTRSYEVHYTEHFGMEVDSTGLVLDLGMGVYAPISGFRTYWNRRHSKNILIPQTL